jgi:AraC family transcriptional regulator, ethanolamine operon transcriptional activator
MSFFADLAHQISANATDAPRRSFLVSVTHAEDVDELVEKVRGYHIDFSQIDKGPFAAELVQAELAGVLLSAAQYGRSLVHGGEPPSEKITFAFGTSGLPARWQGHDFGPDDLLVCRSSTEIDLVSPAGYGVATASVAPDLVKATADNLRLPSIANVANSLVIPLVRNKASMLRALLDAVFSDAVARPYGDRAAHWSVTKQEDLLRILLSCAGNATPEAKYAGNRERARAMKAALAAINDRRGDILSIGDLCRIARASERTLDYAFMERFGLSPALYMKVQRLNGARRDLCGEHEPSMNIADVANKWGFWHLGQFARDYRNWFCELPSATYKKAQYGCAVANSVTNRRDPYTIQSARRHALKY